MKLVYALQKNFLADHSKAVLVYGSFVLFISCDCHDFASDHCCLMVSCWERADVLALVCDVYCDFVTFSFGILGQVWCLIVSILDPCCLSYFYILKFRHFGFLKLSPM